MRESVDASLRGADDIDWKIESHGATHWLFVYTSTARFFKKSAPRVYCTCMIDGFPGDRKDLLFPERNSCGISGQFVNRTILECRIMHRTRFADLPQYSHCHDTDSE